jgi:hypothetical protein
MDITPQNNPTQPISDDQELAQALAGVMPDEPEETQAPEAPIMSAGLQFEETPAQGAQNVQSQPAAPETTEGAQDMTATDAATTEPGVPTFQMPAVPPVSSSDDGDITSATSSSTPSDLDGIKASALNELRPLIDHVDLPAEEKFDTYLMLIRSTDDSSLIAPAHAAAQNITDEKRKAEALLDVIKEIDYLSHKN